MCIHWRFRRFLGRNRNANKKWRINKKSRPTTTKVFLEKRSTRALRKWSTYSEEAYAIFQTFDRMDNSFHGKQPVRIFTNHRNLLYFFAPTALLSNSCRHVPSKVHRWAILLSRFEFLSTILMALKTFLLTYWRDGRKHIGKQQCEELRPCMLTLSVWLER